MEDEKKYYVQLSKEGFEACCQSNASYGYTQGVKDSLRGMSLGITIVALAGLTALIVDTIVEKYKHRKQTEEVTKEISE